MATLPTLASSASIQYLPNDRFAHQIADAVPIQWKDFSAIQRDVYKCLDDKKLETPVCRQVREKMNSALLSGLSQAHILNTLAKPNDPKFCDTYGRQLIIDQKWNEAVVYALLIVDERMKYGSSLYGETLPTTYLGKIVHDSLMESQPCKPQ